MKIVKEGKNKNIKNETVPIQELIDLTVEGIPQEIIDEIYDDFDVVHFDNYKKKRPRHCEIYAGDFYVDVEDGEFQFQDEMWNVRNVKGTLRERYTIVGHKKKDGSFDLFSVVSYNTILPK